MHLHSDTIAAISTPPGKGGVAIIRISGPDAIGIADRCFRPRCGEALSSLSPRQMHYGEILRGGESIDDGLAVVFRAPGSYTGEDTVELFCHGGALIQRMVLEGILAAGATPAPAGEFTRRAFLSGKLSLSDAEAVGMALEAVTEEQVRLSASASRSRLAEEAERIHLSLLSLMSSLYAVIDYPDEDLAELSPEEIKARLSEILEALAQLSKSYRTGRAIRDGISAVLCGRPNVGKSSVYNRLLGEDAAIITPYAGTTRDVLEAPVSLGRVLLRLSDTAGVRETSDPVESIGVERSRARIASSELILAVLDTSAPLGDEDRELLDLVKKSSGTPLILCNKCDLPPVWDATELRDEFPHVLLISADRGDGFAELAELIEELCTDTSLTVGLSPIVSSARQAAAIAEAHARVAEALDAFSRGVPTDAAASSLEAAMASLAELDGRAVSEEIVSSIFSHFCVGK